jgi:hypothetical protein
VTVKENSVKASKSGIATKIGPGVESVQQMEFIKGKISNSAVKRQGKSMIKVLSILFSGLADKIEVAKQ